MGSREAAALLIGAVAGFVGGLFGVGGGVVMVPGLVLALGVTQHRAHATSVAAIVAAASAAVAPLAAEGKVDWAAAGWLLIGAVAGAVAGARLLGRLSEVMLARAFLVLVVIAAVRMALGGNGDGTDVAGGAVEIDAVTAVAFVGIGLFAGGLAALLGVGGGIVYVPALVTLFSVQQHIAQSISLAVIVPTAVVAAVTHGRAGRVDWRLAALLSAGGLLGGLGGAATALATDGGVLRRLFALLLVVTAARMLAGERRQPPAA